MQQCDEGLVNRQYGDRSDDERSGRSGQRVGTRHPRHSRPLADVFANTSAAEVCSACERPSKPSCQIFDIINRLLRLWPMLIVGIDIDCPDDTGAVDDKPARHWQGPTVLTIPHREVVAEA